MALAVKGFSITLNNKLVVNITFMYNSKYNFVRFYLFTQAAVGSFFLNSFSYTQRCRNVKAIIFQDDSFFAEFFK